mmetsp:Transcript_8718/g.21036  ORF Transcript_8718/g.21036 Transcript_8718/m.21036 type:complete len:294 (-) Transcript_8718:1479-2360(-)
MSRSYFAWEQVLATLVQRRHLTEQQTVSPCVASFELLADVHSTEYLDAVRRKPHRVATICELAPLAILPNAVVQRRAAGIALQRGWAINLGGGMHHASSGAGMGWCMFDDHYLALRQLRRLSGGAISRALYIDLDVHQGNGVCRDKARFQDEGLYILDVFNCEVFPQDAEAEAAIDCRVPLKSGASDEEYLERLSGALERSFADFRPDIVLYNAGTDILKGDPLGRLSVSRTGVIRRDEMVFEACFKAGVPISMALSGGYSRESAAVIADSVSNLFTRLGLGAGGPTTVLSRR